MSSLDKLQIQGIRSFDSEERQVIKFYPLTIILGPNGAGKTSIIEALKYVTTGQTPPNSNGGRTFVLDPSVVDKPVVRAQVKLLFNDSEAKSTTVTRSIELTAKKSRGKVTMSFKSLNAVINRDNQPIDQRCADINNEMLELMGVSRAVLTNVIFCHQEECNWPLSESKVLKDKFDDIFGSMGYVKALERIRKLRQTESQKQKLAEKEVKFAQHVKEEADNKRKQKARYVAQLDALKTIASDCETRLQVLRPELQEIVGKEESIQTVLNQINRIKGSLNEKQKTFDKSKANIKTPFEGTDEELKSAIENFAANNAKTEESKKELQIKESEINKSYAKLNETQQSLTKELNKLQFAEQRHKELLLNRNEMVSRLAEETGVTIDVNLIDKITAQQMLDSTDISVVSNVLVNGLTKLDEELVKSREDCQKSNQDLCQQLTDYSQTKSKYEHEVKLRSDEQNKKQQTLKDLKAKLLSNAKSATEYEALNVDIKRLTEEIKQLESVDIDSKKQDIQTKESEKKALKSEINILDEKLNVLREQNDERIKLDIMTKDRKEKQRKVDEVNEIHGDVMKTVGAISGEFHSSLQNHIMTINTQMEKKSTEVSKKENELTSEETKVEIKSNELKRKKKEVKDLETKLKPYCKVEDFETTLTAAQTALKDLRIGFSGVENHEPFLKSQIHSIDCNDSCPVCEHDLSLEWNTKDGKTFNKKQLIGKLETLVKQTPDSIQKLNNNIKSKEKEVNELIGLRSAVQSIKSLNAEIPKIETQLNSMEEQNAEQKRWIQTQKLLINKQKSELNTLRDILQVANECDKDWTAIQELDKKIKSIDLSQDSESGSIDEVAKDLQQKKSIYDEIESKLSETQKIVAQHSENYHKKQSSLQSCERKKLEIEKREHEMTSYKQKVEELTAEVASLDESIMDSQLKAMETKPKIDEIKGQILDKNNEVQDIEKQMHLKMNLVKDKQKELERLTKEIDKYVETGNTDKMNELNDKLSEEKTKMSSLEEERQSLRSEINRLCEEISGVEVRKRELQDCMTCAELQEEIAKDTNQLKEEEEKLGFNNIEELRQKKKTLEKEVKNFESKANQSLSKQEPIIDVISQIEKELSAEPHKSADLNFKKRSIDLVISEIAGDDLNKYYKALDIAVSDFHRKKIDELNKYIKGLWKQAYRGLDIDYIKIVSDETERSANDKRRSFNYRVVMVKGLTEMDMRGRCSAGQKVLSCLIIRLALAEIFSVNCSVLALDEPTTNLDAENIASFATAITEIVKYRTEHKIPFQMIIITHDEEFLRCLDAETGQYYYKVFKNDKGFSTIVRKSINDTHENGQTNGN